jgi:hypothetical protein
VPQIAAPSCPASSFGRSEAREIVALAARVAVSTG